MVKPVCHIKYEANDGQVFDTEEEAKKHEDSLTTTKLKKLIDSLVVLKDEKPDLRYAAQGYTVADINIAYNSGVYAVITALYNRGHFKEFLQNG